MFTIGEFSRLSRTSPRMLRHYDRLGLLRPAYKNPETGYRHYDSTQLAVLRKIEALQGYGFTLAEVGELLPLASEELVVRIHARRLAAYKELDEMRQTLRQMEDAIVEMEGSCMPIQEYHVILMNDPPQEVFGLRERINVSQTHALFQRLHEKTAELGLARSGVTQLVYLGEEFDYDKMEVEAQVVVAQKTPQTKTRSAQLCAATTHIGPYETVRYAYDAIGKWLAEHPEYEVSGPAIERYIKDEGMAEKGGELETGVLFPVRQK